MSTAWKNQAQSGGRQDLHGKDKDPMAILLIYPSHVHSEKGDGTSGESFPLHFPICTPTHALTSSATCHRHTHPSPWRLCPTKDASPSSTHSPQESGVPRKPPPSHASLPVLPEASFRPWGRFCALTERVNSAGFQCFIQTAVLVHEFEFLQAPEG